MYVGNFSKNSVGEPEIANALEKLGHEVVRISENEAALESLRKKTISKKYNFVLFAKLRIGSDESVRALLKELRYHKVPTVCWLFDLYWGYRREIEIKVNMLPAFGADIVFTTDGGHDVMWKRYNINHFTLRQGIDENVKIGKPIYNTKAEIGFVGGRGTWRGWPYRGELLDFLRANYGNRFGHFGGGGNCACCVTGLSEEREIRHEDLNNLLATLKITICDTVNSPHYWSNRIYETLGRGGFAIHPRVEGLDKEFKEFEHFVPYTVGNFKDLKNKIDYYLEDMDSRERIRKDGFDYCHTRHTYTQRVKDLLRVLNEQKII